MILRKPYKFLIKHFKLIHLLLFLPIIYLIISTNNIYQFFDEYIRNSYTYSQTGNLAGSHINIFMYMAILLIIAISLIIYYLMRQKKKNTKLYMATIIYYLILFVALTFFYNVLSDIELANIEAKTARAYKDISLIVIIPQYFFAFYSIFRGLGFDIKNFKFELDLKDLDIDEKDNEEFEFVLGVETYKYKRTIRRFFREFKYYVLENKFIFTCLTVIASLIILTSLYMHFNVYNKTYSENKMFAHSAFTIKMSDSILTNMDYNGKVITKDKYYLVLKLDIANNSNMKSKLDVNNFRLQIGNDYIVPTLDRTDYFIDFATPYHGEDIRKNTSGTYNLVYELTKKQIKNSYDLKILENIEYKVGDITAHYKILNVKPTKILEKKDKKTYKITEEVKLNETFLGNSTTKINSFEIKDNYIYQYEHCFNNSCRTLNDVISAGYTSSKIKTTLLIIDVSSKIDENSTYSKSIKSINTFYENFFTVECDGTKYSTKNITPANLKNKVVLQAPAKIMSAEKLNLLITVRENTYEIKLKGE